jgi:hypothetical protein
MATAVESLSSIPNIAPPKKKREDHMGVINLVLTKIQNAVGVSLGCLAPVVCNGGCHTWQFAQWPH